MKKFLSIAMAGVMMMSLAGCKKIAYIDDEDDFIDALEDVADIDEDDCYIREDFENEGYDVEISVSASDGKLNYGYLRFEDADDAAEYFEDEMYDEFRDVVDDGDFDGKYKMKFTSSEGYILMNGEEDGDEFLGGDVYGGIFLKNDVIIVVLSSSTKEKNTSKVDEFLRALGLPTP